MVLKLTLGVLLNYWELVLCVYCSALSRSLSSAIDPGITFRPCIALTTEERSRMFNMRYLAETCKKVQLCRNMKFFGTVCTSSLFVFLHNKTLSSIIRQYCMPWLFMKKCQNLESAVMCYMILAGENSSQ